MRYLKSYKIFESYFNSSFIEDIKDMTLELSDEDFEVFVHEVDYTPPYKSGSIKAIAVDIKPSIMFRWSDIKDVVERIEEYCWRKDEGYEIDIEIVSEDEFVNLDQFIEIYGSEEFESEISLLIYSSKDYIDNYGDFGMNESMVDDKIQLLEDLSLELKDAGLQVDIFNGSNSHLIRDPRIHIHTGSRYSNDYKKSIIMRITDDNKLITGSLFDNETITNFIENLKSYGLNPRIMSGGEHFAVFKFDKWSKMTRSTYLYESFQKDTAYTHEYDIYNWFEDLKRQQWNKVEITPKQIKFWSDHFIGEGWYDKISNLVDSIHNSLKSVDYDYINDRMLEVWDELPEVKDKYVMPCVAYGDYENYDKEIDYRYNGLISYQDVKDESRKLDIIIHILIDILYPTLFIGNPSVTMRNSKSQYFVTDEKWQCQNFDIKNYEFKENDEIENGNSRRPNKRLVKSTTTIFSWDLKKKSLYSVDKVLSMYKPCVVIEIGGHNNSHLTGAFKLDDIESKLDEVLPTILPELNYEDIIWDKSRGTRQFDTSSEFYDYTLKITLK